MNDANGRAGNGGHPLQASEAQKRALRLWVVLSRAYWAVEDRVRADLARQGLSGAEFGALEALYHKGPMLLGDLKRKILVSSGGITYVVDRLAEKGLVERRPCATDRRAIWAALTPDGERTMREMFPSHADLIAEAMSGLRASEQKEAARLLRDLGVHAAELEPVASR